MKGETPDQTDARLLTVIANSDFHVLPGVYAFGPPRRDLDRVSPEALACVRDGDQWSELVLASDQPARAGQFTIFSFHFDPKFDATGFVGWLHSHLARNTGVGHFVICGRDQRSQRALDHTRGGIFDYWGCPADRAEAVISEVRAPHRPRIQAMKPIDQGVPSREGHIPDHLQ